EEGKWRRLSAPRIGIGRIAGFGGAFTASPVASPRRSRAVVEMMVTSKSRGTGQMPTPHNGRYVGYFYDRDNAARRGYRVHRWQAYSRMRDAACADGWRMASWRPHQGAG